MFKLSPLVLATTALCAAPLAFSGSYVNGTQSSSMNQAVETGNASNYAHISGNTLGYASGNIAANVAGGLQNQQANTTGIASSGTGGSGSAATAYMTTGQVGLLNYALNMNGNNLSVLQGAALAHASGNLGVNIASGVFNQQRNSMSLASQANGGGAYATAFTGQDNIMNGNFSMYMFNYVLLENHALAYATGNIGVNMASGLSNQQNNSLSVASSTNKSYAPHGVMSSAQVYTNQVLKGLPSTYALDTMGNRAMMDGSVLAHASGNIGVNVAAGALNQQGNNTALSNLADQSGSVDTASSGFDVAQTSMLNVGSAIGVTNDANIEGNVAAHASGNVAINMAVGVGNQQQNGLTLANVASKAAMVSATAPVMQQAALNSGTMINSSYADAGLGGNALRGATGNISVNIASGEGNQQANVLAIASAQ